MESVTKVQRDQPGKWTKARSTPQGQKRAEVFILISLRASRWTSFIYFPVRLQRQAILHRKNQSTTALWTSYAWSSWRAAWCIPWPWNRWKARRRTKNSRRCLPVSGRQRRRIGWAAVWFWEWHSGDRKTCRLGYDKVQHLCKDGDSVHPELAGGAAAERGCCDVWSSNVILKIYNYYSSNRLIYFVKSDMLL